jgi:VIT1/CCC1 family predicted Fe2+/Mn2+ transporter
VDRSTLILTGTAGLVAGAISMGIGEYTSVRTQNEQVGAELAKELHELRANPDGEAAELVAVWTARGLPRPLAEQVADVLKAHPEQALRVHAQEELASPRGPGCSAACGSSSSAPSPPVPPT